MAKKRNIEVEMIIRNITTDKLSALNDIKKWARSGR